MDESYRNGFISKWAKYFGDAKLPMAVFFSDDPGLENTPIDEPGQCVIGLIPGVVKGSPLCFSAESKICGGARRYLGFADESAMPNFEYFLSYGIPGKMKGERYKKTPDLVRESLKTSQPFKAPKPYIVFKRWDKLTAADEPEVVVFLAGLDTISGLFALANYDEDNVNAVICPFGSGCSSIVYHPYKELRSQRPRCIIGMFDVSARPYVGENTLSFAAPYPKFQRMVDNMDESFLITESWKSLRHRG